jgi:hypothetical protein
MCSETGLDLEDEHIPAPAILDGMVSVPKPLLRGFDLLQECDVVVPGDLCKRRLHN